MEEGRIIILILQTNACRWIKQHFHGNSCKFVIDLYLWPCFNMCAVVCQPHVFATESTPLKEIMFPDKENLRNRSYLAKNDAATEVPVDTSLATYVLWEAGKLYKEGLSAL